MSVLRTAFAATLAASLAGPAWAQRAGEHAVTSADDAFGTSVGNETIGLYTPDEVRGFSPGAAGNIRMDGLYLGGLFVGNPRLVAGSTIRASRISGEEPDTVVVADTTCSGRTVPRNYGTDNLLWWVRAGERCGQ